MKFDPEKPASPAYREAIEAGDAAREREAMERGESFTPTFSNPTRPFAPTERVGPPPETIPPAAPPTIQDLPPEAPAVADEPETRAEPPAAQYRERLPERDRGGDRDVSSPLDALLEVLAEQPGKVTWLDYAGGREEPERADAEAQAGAPLLPGPLAGLQVGKGLYARTLYEANSDWPGPVVLEILEPPLAGAVATGAFQESNERLVIRIDRLSLGGDSWAVEGWAVDLGCACYGIPGRVDRHWFQRVLLPSALAFAEGFLDAAAQTARVVTRDTSGGLLTVDSAAPSHRQQVYAGAATATKRVGSVLLESVPDGPTVRVPRNTELVLVVTAPPVAERPAGAAPQAVEAPGRPGHAGRNGPAAVIGAGPATFARQPAAGSAPGRGRAR